VTLTLKKERDLEFDMGCHLGHCNAREISPYKARDLDLNRECGLDLKLIKEFFSGILLLSNDIRASGPIGAELSVRDHRVRVHQRVHGGADAAAVAALRPPPALPRLRARRCRVAHHAGRRAQVYCNIF
jgi:hypothetical protein